MTQERELFSLEIMARTILDIKRRLERIEEEVDSIRNALETATVLTEREH